MRCCKMQNGNIGYLFMNYVNILFTFAIKILNTHISTWIPLTFKWWTVTVRIPDNKSKRSSNPETKGFHSLELRQESHWADSQWMLTRSKLLNPFVHRIFPTWVQGKADLHGATYIVLTHSVIYYIFKCMPKPRGHQVK
jgi:hypothetical protein